MSDPGNVDIEKGAALAAALEQLFEQYPARNEVYLYWRERAIGEIDTGNLARAFALVRSAGIPGDVLDALRGLLDG